MHQDLHKLADEQVGFRLQQLTARVGDLHTRVVWKSEARFPLTFTQFGDDLYVDAVASEDYRSLLGAKLVRIGGVTVHEAITLASSLISAENIYAIKALAPSVLTSGEALTFLGMSEGPRSADFQFDSGGTPMGMKLQSSKAAPSASWIKAPKRTPFHESRSGEFYWFQYLADSRALYINYSRCAEQKDVPFAAFVESIARVLDQSEVDRVVIDVRTNPGGNEAVIRPLISELKHRRSKVFVLIGRRTFSSAFGNALTIKEDLGGVLVGEPTGQKPNSFGELRSFELPHSGLKVHYSTKFWKRIGSGDPDALYPDIPVETAIAPHLEGRDLALEAALAR